MLKWKDVARCVLFGVGMASLSSLAHSRSSCVGCSSPWSTVLHLGPVGSVPCCDFLCWLYYVGQCIYELGTCSLVSFFFFFCYSFIYVVCIFQGSFSDLQLALGAGCPLLTLPLAD